MEAKILFDSNSAELIINAIGYEVKDGYIVDEQGKRATTYYGGEEVPIKKLGGVYKKDGVVYFLNEDLHSIIQFAKREMVD